VQGGIRFGREEVKAPVTKGCQQRTMQDSLCGHQWRLVTSRARNRL
jgi:hypothetical protein